MCVRVFTPRGLDSPPQLHQRFVRESWSLTSKDVRALRPVSQESLGTCLASFVHFVIAAYAHPNPPLAQKWLVSVEFWMLSGLKNFGFFKWPIFDYSSLHGLKKWSVTEHSKVAVKEKIFEFRLLTVPFKKTSITDYSLFRKNSPSPIPKYKPPLSVWLVRPVKTHQPE